MTRNAPQSFYANARRPLPQIAVALCALLFVGSAAHAQQADNAPETLKVQVRLVSLFVNVTDAHGSPVADLAKTNFALSEDGQPQSIAYFEKQTSVPLSVVLAIDTSGSTRKDLGPERRGARDFAQALLTPKDQLSLFDFNSDVRQAVPFTNNIHQIESGLGTLSKGPATALYAAVLLASQNLQPRSGRKVLVIVSDGDDTVGGTTYDEALAEAQRDDVMIYSLIDVPIEADAGRDTAGEHALITLSQETGGRSFYVAPEGSTRANQETLSAAFQKVSDDLRTQYLLGYYPRHPNHPSDPLAGKEAFHSIHITLEDLAPSLVETPHYRSGYYRSAARP